MILADKVYDSGGPHGQRVGSSTRTRRGNGSWKQTRKNSFDRPPDPEGGSLPQVQAVKIFWERAKIHLTNREKLRIKTGNRPRRAFNVRVGNGNKNGWGA